MWECLKHIKNYYPWFKTDFLLSNAFTWFLLQNILKLSEIAFKAQIWLPIGDF